MTDGILDHEMESWRGVIFWEVKPVDRCSIVIIKKQLTQSRPQRSGTDMIYNRQGGSPCWSLIHSRYTNIFTRIYALLIIII
jgi:hypothetical protein